MRPYYEHGGITIYHGDALAIMAELSDVSAVLTDPPYSTGGLMRGDRLQDVYKKYLRTSSESGHALGSFSGDTRDAYGYWFWCSVWLSGLMRVVEPGGVCALFTDWRQLGITIAGLQSGGWVYRGVVPWFKPNGRPTQSRWSNVCEYVVWGTNGPRSLDHIGMVSFPGFFQASAPAPADRDHITQKPIDVMREMLVIVPRDGIVLDPFMGSGTTLLAAMERGCRGVGIDADEQYCEIAATRLSQHVLPFELPRDEPVIQENLLFDVSA